MVCLICNCDCDNNYYRSASGNCSGFLDKHLQNVFVLRKVLELPTDKLAEYLGESGDNVGEWFGVCDQCGEEVDGCWRIWEELMDVRRRFKESQRRIVEVIRKSLEEGGLEEFSGDRVQSGGVEGGNKVVQESRQFVKTNNYGGLVNPFTEGDFIAKLKAGELLEVVKIEPKDELQEEGADEPGNNSEPEWGPAEESDWEASSDTDTDDLVQEPKLKRVREETVCLVPSCSKPFSNYSFLDVHMRTEHTMEERKNGRRVKCRKCGSPFLTYKARVEHENHPDHEKMARRNTVKPCQVPGCLEVFTHTEKLDKHLLSEHTPKDRKLAKKFECPICSKLVLTFKAIYQHCQKIHQGGISLASKARLVTPPPNEEEEEDDADKDLRKTLYQIYEHRETSNNEDGSEKSCLVPSCSKTFSRYQGLDKHLMSEHTMEERKMGGRLECLRCGKLHISYMALFSHHLQTHAQVPREKVACVVPGGNGETFSEEDEKSLERLELAYSVELKPCLVATCTETFIGWRDLDKHLQYRHTRLERKAGWRLECPECGKLYQSYNGVAVRCSHLHKQKPADPKYVMISEKKEEPVKMKRKCTNKKRSCLIPECPKVVYSWSELDRHLDAKHTMEERESGRKLECVKCGHLVISYKNLCDHNLREHGTEASSQGGIPDKGPEQKSDNLNSAKVGAWHCTKSFLCPLCKKYRSKRGPCDLMNLCLHLDTCRKEKYPETEDSALLPLLKCPSCQEFQCTAQDPSVFANHWMGCRLPSRHFKLRDRVFSCDVCRNDKVWQGQRFFTFGMFLKHYLLHQSVRFECVQCGERLENTGDTQRHWMNKHVTLITDNWKFSMEECSRKLEPYLVPSIPWWCAQCHIQFSTEDARDEHVNTEHLELLNQNNHRCSFCAKSYACEAELNLHQETTHLVEMGKLYPCNLCEDQYFSEQKQVLWHLREFHKKQVLKCFQCPMEFGKVDQLSKHLETEHKGHSAEEGDKCQKQCATCGKLFKNQQSLRGHRNLKHKGTQRVCHLCGETFPVTRSLKRHLLKVHKLGKPKEYACKGTGCTEIFPDLVTRGRHFNECHSAERKTFKCSTCGVDFLAKAGLTLHQRFYHPVTTDVSKHYKCELCEYSSPWKRNLKRHRKAEHSSGNDAAHNR